MSYVGGMFSRVSRVRGRGFDMMVANGNKSVVMMMASGR